MPVGKKVQGPGVTSGVLVFESSLGGIMISEYARCRLDSSSDITSALEIDKSGANLISDRKGCLEIWDVPWRIPMETTRRGTFTSSYWVLTGFTPCADLPRVPATPCPYGVSCAPCLWTRNLEDINWCLETRCAWARCCWDPWEVSA